MQIATKIEDVYEIYLPSDVRALLQQLRIVISLGIEGVPLACVQADGYEKRLQFWMWTPLVLVALATLTVMVHLLYHRAHSLKRLSPALIFEHVMPVVLRIAFLS